MCNCMCNATNTDCPLFCHPKCGYPIFCPGEQPRFVEPQFFVGQLANCGIEESQLRRFFDDAKEIFHDTGMPMFPCIFHHFCLPFSPICAAAYCSKKRKVRQQADVPSRNLTMHVVKSPLLLYGGSVHVYIGSFATLHNNAANYNGTMCRSFSLQWILDITGSSVTLIIISTSRM